MRRALNRVLIILVSSLCPELVNLVKADDSAEIQALKKQVETLQRTVEQLQNIVQSMQGVPTRAPSPTKPQSAIDQFMTQEGIATDRPSAIRAETTARPSTGAAAQRYIDLSFIPSFFGGASSKRDGALQTLQAGGHDPRKRGFTLAEVTAELVLEREGDSEEGRMRARLASGLVSVLIDTTHNCWMEAGANEPLHDVGERCRGMMGDMIGTMRLM